MDQLTNSDMQILILDKLLSKFKEDSLNQRYEKIHTVQAQFNLRHRYDDLVTQTKVL